jgi:transcriptional repressor NrdR
VKCPSCSAPFEDVIVKDSRPRPTSVRRRRECQKCGARFTTSEIIVRDKKELRELRGVSQGLEAINVILGNLQRTVGSLHELKEPE